MTDIVFKNKGKGDISFLDIPRKECLEITDILFKYLDKPTKKKAK